MGQKQIVGHTREDMLCEKGMRDNIGRTMNERCIVSENCYYLEEDQKCISINTIMSQLQPGTTKSKVRIGRSDRTLFSHEPSSQMHILPSRERRGNGYHVLKSLK